MPTAPDRLAAFHDFQRTELHIEQNLDAALENIYRPLARQIMAAREATPGMLTMGVCGAQGSGKSTLANILRFILQQEGLSVAALSIDDIYLPWADRRRIQHENPGNPYYQVSRGNPGTHDVRLGVKIISQLRAADASAVTPIPAFDKSLHEGNGDRLPPDAWPTFRGRPDVFILEGWCVGMRSLPPAELRRLTQNVPEALAFERERDPDGRYGEIVNERLREYEPLFDLIDRLVFLKTPSLAKVVQWRIKQERALRARTGRGMSDEQIGEFIRPYMLLSGIHGLQILGDCHYRLASTIVELGEDQLPHRVTDCESSS